MPEPLPPRWPPIQKVDTRGTSSKVYPWLWPGAERGKEVQTHFSCSIWVRVPFQQQLRHPNLPILSRHMERGKSFLRRDTGCQNRGVPEPSAPEQESTSKEVSHRRRHGDANHVKDTTMSDPSKRPRPQESAGFLSHLPPAPLVMARNHLVLLSHYQLVEGKGCLSPLVFQNLI